MAGTDKGVPGFSLQRELELYVEGGMTPLEAIQAATIMPARAMKLDKDVGTIEVGKRADLVVLDARSAREHPQHPHGPLGRVQRPDVRLRRALAAAGYGPVAR